MRLITGLYGVAIASYIHISYIHISFLLHVFTPADLPDQCKTASSTTAFTLHSKVKLDSILTKSISGGALT